MIHTAQALGKPLLAIIGGYLMMFLFSCLKTWGEYHQFKSALRTSADTFPLTQNHSKRAVRDKIDAKTPSLDRETFRQAKQRLMRARYNILLREYESMTEKLLLACNPSEMMVTEARMNRIQRELEEMQKELEKASLEDSTN